MFQFGSRGSGKTLTELENILKMIEFLRKPIYMTKRSFNFGLQWFPKNFKYIDGKWYINNVEVKIIGGNYANS